MGERRRTPRIDPGVLLAVGAFLWGIRAPLGFLAMGLLATGTVILQGRHLRHPLLVAFGVAAVVSSTLAWAHSPSSPASSYLALAACSLPILLSVEAHSTRQRNTQYLVTGLALSLWAHFLISLAELISGFRILPFRTPGASTSLLILNNPWLVSSLFANYNDYALAMALFAAYCSSRILMNRGSRMNRLLHVGAGIIAVGLILITGSRGALIALAASLALQLLFVLRLNRPHLWSVRSICWATLVLVIPVVAVWRSPWIQNNSTHSRGLILSRATDMLLSSPTHLLLGYGSPTNYANEAAQRWPGALMDPHNLFLEISLAHGIITLALFLALYFRATWYAVFLGRIRPTSIALFATSSLIALPLYGVIPSTILSYGYPLIILATGVVSLSDPPHPEHRPSPTGHTETT